MPSMGHRRQATYVDTSVWCAYCFNEKGSEPIVEWLAAMDMQHLGASWWVETEFASALSIKMRNKGLNKLQAAAAQERFAEVMDMVKRLNLMEADFLEAATSCAAFQVQGLRGGDALHLAVAQRHGCTYLASLDADMCKCAKRMGFQLIDWS